MDIRTRRGEMDERGVEASEQGIPRTPVDRPGWRTGPVMALLALFLFPGTLALAATASPLAAQVSNGASGAHPGVVGASDGADPAPAPYRIALQAGHWRSYDAPDELARLRSNGTRGGGMEEWEVTLRIARLAAEHLEALGYEVEVLPATVPPGYRADLFIAIHADGFHSPAASGFSISPPRRDATGRGAAFAEVLAGEYREVTGLRHRQATRRMAGYYAFNNRRYHHAIDPSTPAVILEAGFLTSPSDQELLIRDPARAARGISQAVVRFLPLAAVADREDR